MQTSQTLRVFANETSRVLVIAFREDYKAHPIQAFFIPKYANAIPMYFHLHFFLFRTKFVI